jgi:hypothetical protein
MKWRTHKIFYLIFLTLLLNSACRPEKKGNVSVSAAPDTAGLKALADSGSFFNQDGLDYEPLNTSTFDQLPDELRAVLNKNTPGWSLPFISQEYLQQKERDATGPYFVEADLNQDALPDFAVQYRFKDTIYVDAYLKNKEGQLQKYLLTAYHITEQDKESRLYLSLLRKGKQILTNSVPEKKQITLPQNAIAVDSPDQSALFYFTGAQINRLEIRREPAN